jgi:Domain of unknown function (DUF4192)
MLRVKADAPDALLAVVPHLLGFYPSESLVVLGIGGKRSRVQLTFRYDLPDPPDAALTADIADHAVSVCQRQRIRLAVLIGYGPAEQVVPALATVMKWLLVNGVGLREVLRAEGGRYWSLLCEDPECCPPEGRPFDPGSHPVASTMTEAGMTAMPDRAALARSLLPRSGSTETIRKSTTRAEQMLWNIGAAHFDEVEDVRLVTATVGKAAVQDAIQRYRAGERITDGDELAWISVLLADLRVRDDAWARMDPEHYEAHIRLWTDVLKGAATEYVPAPAALLAFAAWQSGNGALGGVALDRALGARPDYSMALLLQGALTAGLPPSAAKLPMSPEEVAASYEAQDERRRSPKTTRARRQRRGQPDTAVSGTARSGTARSGGRSSKSRSAAPGETTSGASSLPSG